MFKNAIFNIADSLASKGKYLVFSPNSPLTEVDYVSGPIENDYEMINTLGDTIGKTLSKELSFYKNSVRNEILEFIRLVESERKRYSQGNVEPMELVKIEVPLAIEMLLERKEITAKETIVTKPFKFSIGQKSVESIKEIMKVGGGQLKRQIENFISEINENTIERIWETYVSNINTDNPNFNTLRIVHKSSDDNKDLFVLFLILRGIFEHKDERLIIEDDVYYTAIGYLRDLVGNYIIDYNQLLTSYVSTDRLIIRKEENKVLVCGPIYEKFISEEGDVDALLGATIDGDILVRSIILDNHEHLISKWNKHLRNTSVANNLALSKAMGTIYDSVAREMYSEDENKLLKIVNYIGSLEYSEMDEIDIVANHIVTKIIYSHTNAETFFGYMNTYMKSNPTINVKEAATFATLELTIDFLLGQVIEH